MGAWPVHSELRWPRISSSSAIDRSRQFRRTSASGSIFALRRADFVHERASMIGAGQPAALVEGRGKETVDFVWPAAGHSRGRHNPPDEHLLAAEMRHRLVKGIPGRRRLYLATLDDIVHGAPLRCFPEDQVALADAILGRDF